MAASRSTTAQPPSYHHGALRAALLDAAEAILLERGVEAFSLRECARRAGVSHAAPAHHFGDAKGLLTAFATLGFERMADRMAKYRERAGADPVAQLLAVGQAYIDFALAHRAQFQLMFRRDRLDATDTECAAAGGRAAAMLNTSLAAAMRSRGLSFDDAPQRTLLAWAAVHGFATLALEGVLKDARLLGGGRTAASTLGAQMLRALEPALVGAPPTPGRR